MLVNNAGGWGGAGRQYPEASAGEWSRVLDLNLQRPCDSPRRCWSRCGRAGGGAVVNVASGAGLELSPYGSPEYAAAKAGLIRFTAAVASLRETHGVRVDCVVPGWIGLDRAYAERAALPAEAQAAAPPFVSPEAVARAVVNWPPPMSTPAGSSSSAAAARPNCWSRRRSSRARRRRNCGARRPGGSVRSGSCGAPRRPDPSPR